MKLTKRSALASATALLALALAGCGGGSSSPVATVTVVPALGATYSATVDLIDASGTLASGTTGAKGSSNAGKATLETFRTAVGPVVVRVTLTPASSYFDEKSGTDKTVTANASLLSVTPTLTGSTAVGVTPLTNMAAKLAGVSATATAAPATLNTDVIATAVAKTNLALGLPASYNILQVPTAVATSTATIPTTGYSALVAQIAQTGADALASATTLASAVSTDGTVANASTLQTVNNILRTIVPPSVVAVSTQIVTDNAALVTAATAVKDSIKTAISAGATGASN